MWQIIINNPLVELILCVLNFSGSFKIFLKNSFIHS